VDRRRMIFSEGQVVGEIVRRRFYAVHAQAKHGRLKEKAPPTAMAKAAGGVTVILTNSKQQGAVLKP